MAEEHRLKLTSDREAIEGLLDWLGSRLEGGPLQAMPAFHLQCAVVELVNNSVQHGYRNRRGQPLEIAIRQHEHEVEVEVRDWAPAFTCEPALDMADPMARSGRGLAIIRAWVDDINFERCGPCNIFRVRRKVS